MKLFGLTNKTPLGINSIKSNMPQRITLQLGDCISRLQEYPEQSIDGIVTDPPYGLEFFQTGTQESNGFRRAKNEKDSSRNNIIGRVSKTSPEYKTGWQTGAGFSKTGLGDRPTQWVSFGASTPFGGANPTCATCGGRLRGAKKCSCAEPVWKVKGEVQTAVAGKTQQQVALALSLRAWHAAWLEQCYRVLVPEGTIWCFSSTRTYHHLAQAMRTVGFQDLSLKSWVHMQGFPKSVNVSRGILEDTGNESLAQQWSGYHTALKPSFEVVLVGRKK